MSKNKKPKDYKYYRLVFNDEMSSGKNIYNRDKTITYESVDGERWRQCYDPDDPVRKDFKEYLFVSDKGNLISVKGGKARLLTNTGSRDYHNYRMNIDIGNGESVNKDLGVHNLVNIVFNGLYYGKARERLNEQGVLAINTKGIGNSVQTHHINSIKMDNRLENTELLTNEVHSVITYVPESSDPNKTLSFMQKFSRVAHDEEPNKVSVLLAGQTIDRESKEITSKDHSTVIHTVEYRDIPNELLNKLNESNTMYLLLCNFAYHLGYDFFSKPRFISFYDSYLRIYYDGKRIHIRKALDSNEIDYCFMKCYFNEYGILDFELSDSLIGKESALDNT